MNIEERKKLALSLHQNKNNCAQSVLLAFKDKTGMDDTLSKNISMPFGGGLGRQGEVCGAVSGMCMVLGAANILPNDQKSAYSITREVCNEFTSRHGSIVCREILRNAKLATPPNADYANYFGNNSCERCIEDAIDIIAKKIDPMTNNR